MHKNILVKYNNPTLIATNLFISREKVCLLWGTNEVDWVENKTTNSAWGFLRCGVISRFRCLVL